MAAPNDDNLDIDRSSDLYSGGTMIVEAVYIEVLLDTNSCTPIGKKNKNETKLEKLRSSRHRNNKITFDHSPYYFHLNLDTHNYIVG